MKMTNEEMKQFVQDAVGWAQCAAEFAPDNPDNASVSAQVSIAKSLTVIAALLTEATYGKASINVYKSNNSI